MAEGEYHENEDAYLRRVTEIFELDLAPFEVLRVRHVREHRDPYRVLGIMRNATWSEV